MEYAETLSQLGRMTVIKCGKCGIGLVSFATIDDNGIKFKITGNWIIANCTNCDKTTGIDGVTQ